MISHPATPLYDPWRSARIIDRVEVDFSTVMRSPEDCGIEVRLVNISPQGFMVRVEKSFQQGELVIISLPVAGDVRAKVAWALGGRLGGQFLSPIPSAHYTELVREASKPSPRWPA